MLLEENKLQITKIVKEVDPGKPNFSLSLSSDFTKLLSLEEA